MIGSLLDRHYLRGFFCLAPISPEMKSHVGEILARKTTDKMKTESSHGFVKMTGRNGEKETGYVYIDKSPCFVDIIPCFFLLMEI